MFNIVGIFAALVIAETSRGRGIFVGWESMAGAVGVCVAVLLIGWPMASMLRARFAILNDLEALLAGLPDAEAQRRRVHAERLRVGRRMGWLQRGYDLLVVAAYAAVCFVFGWTDFLQSVGVPRDLAYVPVLLPYLAVLILAWVNEWRLIQVVHRGVRFSSFMGTNVRVTAMMLAPLVFVTTLLFALRWSSVAVEDAMDSFMSVKLSVHLLSMLVVALILPAVIPFILPTTRLKDGPLRRRLLGFAAARGIRVAEVYVWHTRNRYMATAFVIGLVSPLRYVFVTNALRRRLSHEEIEAVFAHELGHAYYGHLWWLLGLLISLISVMMGSAALMGSLKSVIDDDQFSEGLFNPGVVAPLLLTVLFAYFAFGYVFRRIERQADLYAASHTDPNTLVRVFRKLSRIVGEAPNRRGWRYFPLNRRIAEIKLARLRPEVKRLFNRQLLAALALIALISVACAALLVPAFREDFVTGRMSYAFARFDRARVAGSGTAEIDALRAQVLARAQSVRDLDDHNRRVAEIYTAVTLVLSGSNPDALSQTKTALAAEASRPVNHDQREYFDALVAFVEQSERAAKRARQDNTRWDEEMAKEMRASER